MDKIHELVTNFQRKSIHGFNINEQLELISQVEYFYPNFNMDKFESALEGVTCMREGESLIIYPIDVLHALECGCRDEDLPLSKWDWEREREGVIISYLKNL